MDRRYVFMGYGVALILAGIIITFSSPAYCGGGISPSGTISRPVPCLGPYLPLAVATLFLGFVLLIIGWRTKKYGRYIDLYRKRLSLR